MANIQKAKEGKKIKGELMLSSSPLSAKQLLFVLQKTPKEHIYHRPGKGGGEFEYVTATYMKKVLNYAFGWMWDFEIKEHGQEKDLIWVLGKLTIKDKTGKPMIVKEQFGRSEVKYYKDRSKGTLDIGNDLKAATSDSLKKCASELGIASDIYGKQEFREIQHIDKGFIGPKDENGKAGAKNGKSGIKVEELKEMLKGKTDGEKLIDLKKRTGIVLVSFNISDRHAGILIASLLNVEVKK
jgi:hypothetical protein